MEKYNDTMMEVAELFAKKSYANRRKVGAVLARDGRILATGYNGTVPGKINICEIFIPYDPNYVMVEGEHIEKCPVCNNGMSQPPVAYTCRDDECFTCKGTGKLIVQNKTSKYTLHAEQNIITYCAKKGISMEGAYLYVTTAPCETCAKLLSACGIKRVFYKEEYDSDGIGFLQDCGILSCQL